MAPAAQEAVTKDANPAETAKVLKTNVASMLPLLFVREWALLSLLLLGGCCGSVFTLEILARSFPASGNLITFCQFVLVALEGMISSIEWRFAERHKHDSDSTTADVRGDKHTNHETTRWSFPIRLRERKVPITNWMVVVFFFVTTSVINNYALKFRVAMPVQIVFRSGSLLASMLMTRIFFKGAFSSGQISGAILVTIGIVLATLRPSTSGSAPNNVPVSEWLMGIAVLTVGLLIGCLLGQLQQYIYTKYGQQWREGLFYTHALSLPTFIFMYDDLKKQVSNYNASPLISIRDIIAPWISFVPLSHRILELPGTDVVFAIQVPELWIYLAWNVVTQYVCISAVHKLSSMSSAVTLNLFLTIRKFISLLISVIIFKNEFTTQNWIGAAAVFIGTILYSLSKRPSGSGLSVQSKTMAASTRHVSDTVEGTGTEEGILLSDADDDAGKTRRTSGRKRTMKPQT